MNLRCFAACAVFSLQLFAGPKVEVLSPLFRGTGCPKNSTDVFISANAKQVDLVFNRFVLEADNAVGVPSVAKDCETAVRIKVPHGYSVAVRRVRYLGNYELPFGSNVVLAGTHFFNEDEFARMSQRYYGRSEGELDVGVRIHDYNLSWSACGEEAVLASSTKVALQATKSVSRASFVLGEELLSVGISYDLLWRPCQQDVLD